MSSLLLHRSVRRCKINDCDKKHYGRGWCYAHYNRWKRNGDPLGGNTSPGEPLRYLQDVVLSYVGDDCLIWPFERSVGYGRVRIDGRPCVASRLACEAVNGPAPTPKHHAAHNCGNGHLGCVNPKHLRWATPKENASDKYLHGTATVGERNGTSKLTTEQVQMIRKDDRPQHVVAKDFGVSRSSIGNIRTGKTWEWLA